MPAGLGASACMQMNNTAAAPGMGKSVPSAYPSSSTSSGLHSPRPHFQETMSATLWFPKAQTSTLNHSKRPHHAPPAPMVTTSSWVNPYTENTNFRLLDHHKLALLFRPCHRSCPVPGPHQPTASPLDLARLGGPPRGPRPRPVPRLCLEDCAEASDDDGLSVWYNQA